MADAAYDGFLSYSHADHRLAPALQTGLRRLARPWNRPRALRVFLDDESLSPSPSLWNAIRTALDQSRYFILVASPQAAESDWVAKEVSYWRGVREPATFLIVLSRGTIVWGNDDFDWERTDSLPRCLAGYFTSVPLWVDLRWVRDDEELSLRHSRFRNELRAIAAPLHGKSKDELESEDVREHRKFVRASRVAVSLLVLLLVGVLGLAGITYWQSGIVADQRDRALSRELAGRSELMGDSDPTLAKLLSVAAWRVSPTSEARAAMLLAAGRPGIALLDTTATAVAFSPDGGTLAAGGDAGRIELWDVAKRRRTEVFAGHTERVQSLTFGPEGDTLVSAGDDATVRLWDMATGQQIGDAFRCDEPGPFGYRPPEVHFDPPISVSPDGKALAMGCADGTIRLWDLASRRPVGRLSGHARPQLPLVGPSVAFSPDGSMLASASFDGVLRYWDVSSQRQVSEAAGLLTQSIAFIGPSVVYSADGKAVATVTTDGAVQVWDATDIRRNSALVADRTQPNDDQATTAAAFAPVGDILAVGAHDGTVRLWDVDRGQQIGAALTGHTSAVVDVAFSPKGWALASAGSDGTLRLWNVSTHLQVDAPITGDTGPMYSVAYHPDGRTIVVGSYGDFAVEDPAGPGTCLGGACMGGNSNRPNTRPNTRPTTTLWNVAERALITGHQASHAGVVRSVAVSPDGTTIAAGGTDAFVHQPAGRVSLFQAGDLVGDLRTGTDSVAAVAFDPSGRTLAVAGSGVKLWDVASEELVTELSADASSAVAFSPDGTKLIAGHPDGTATIWDVNARKRLGAVTTPFQGEEGSRVKTGLLYSFTGGEFVAAQGSGGGVGAVAFAPDGETVATAGADGEVWFWDVDSHEQLGEPLVGHTGPIHSIAYSPSGQLLVTGSGDASVRLWDVDARRQVGSPAMRHHLPVRSVVFSPDGHAVASVGLDSALRLWDVGDTVNVVERLCDTAGRSLTSEEWMRYVPGTEYRPICP